jgi:hypothetical protein
LLTRILLFLPVLLMGAWLRLADLDRAGLWLDEPGQAGAVRQPLPVLPGQVRNGARLIVRLDGLGSVEVRNI